jgi:hypothetical protein
MVQLDILDSPEGNQIEDISVLAGIYLNEYAGDNWLTRLVSLTHLFKFFSDFSIRQ